MDIHDELIDRVLDGHVSDDELAGMRTWLEDPANLGRYAQRAELHAHLRGVLRRKRIEILAKEKHGEVVSSYCSAGPRIPTLPKRRRLTLLTVITFVTAACLLVAVGVWYGHWKRQPPLRAATLISEIDALLVHDGQSWSKTALPAGDYQLRQGLLNLRFGGGVRVYIEAPSSFEVVSDERVVLHNGRLSANVPPEGVGFTVETPDAEVIDFGTEFSVDVEIGASEVHVFDGLVRVHPGTRRKGRAGRSVDLRASQAVRISNASGKPVDIELANDRFIRDFDEPRRGYARSVKRLSPLAIYRMAIRDRGLASDPPEYSGVVLTGDGVRPPHARGFFTGGSLRVQANSTGRGGRVDFPPELNTGKFSLAVFVYSENPNNDGTVATNISNGSGSFALSLDRGAIHAQIRGIDHGWLTVRSDSKLFPRTWRHLVITADGEHLKLYENGLLVSSTQGSKMAETDTEPMWFGTTSDGTQLWNGRIDELAIFDKALTEKHVIELYRTALDEMIRRSQ